MPNVERTLRVLKIRGTFSMSKIKKTLRVSKIGRTLSQPLTREDSG